MSKAPAAEVTGHEPAAPEERPVAGSTGPARSGHRALLGHLRPYRARIAAGLAVALVGSVMGLAQPPAAKRVMDDMGQGRPAAGPVLVLSSLVVAGAVLAGVGHYLLQCSAESAVCAARRRLADRILRLRVPVVEDTEPGDLIARVTSDTTLLRQTAPQAVSAAVTGTLVTVATVVLMGLLDAVLLCVTLAVVAFVGVTVALVAPRIGRATRQTQEAVGRIGVALERVLGVFRTVKASGAERREAEVLHRAAEDARRTGVRAAAWEAVSATASAVVVQVSFLVVLGAGGERQRVAIARALLRRPMLLLDEATSQLDAANEAALRDTVTDTARDTTVLVVAHRLSTVTTADRIVVMEAGRVRAVGTHTELMARDALYNELACTQLLNG
ncbi:ABC transporter ATP-binding protein [Streptomyces triculaminicus]|uniref:ABC transporter ATP-binding protein n=1 Tax=Streptomyces triculaminicus TaxID=2816232 RepID=UPI0037D92991